MSATLTRKQRRAARRQAASQIMPPEGVSLHLPVAGVGVRLGAQITDVLITGLFAAAVVILFAVSDLVSANTIVGLAALLFFFIRIPYYVLSELAWNGQTIGKRMMKIKVVSHQGGPLTTHALVLRNIMKEAEIFLPGTLLLTLDGSVGIAGWLSFAWVVLAFAIPLSNPHRMRLGDMLAGTHVVHLPEPILLSDLARKTIPKRTDDANFTFLPHQLDHYGRFELQTLESFLRAQTEGAFARKPDHKTLAAIVARIRKKIGYAEPVGTADQAAFLQAFYNAQRAHLEQRQLFGERRGDKHYAAASKAEDDTPQS